MRNVWPQCSWKLSPNSKARCDGHPSNYSHHPTELNLSKRQAGNAWTACITPAFDILDNSILVVVRNLGLFTMMGHAKSLSLFSTPSSSILSSVLSHCDSSCSGAVVMPSSVLSYVQLGQFLMLIMSISWLYATFFFQAICAIMGPENDTGQLTMAKIRTMISTVKLCCSKNKSDHYQELRKKDGTVVKRQARVIYRK